MKRELFVHFSYFLSFFIFVSIIKGYLNFSYYSFWLGGIIGTFLPDIDHLLYLYLRPQELTAQRVGFLIDKREVKRVVTLLYETRGERKNLIFHTAFFQIIFVILTFWMLSSSGSLFGKGLVLAFSLHLLIDQIVDLTETGKFDNWLKYSPWYLDLKNARIYVTVIVFLTLGLGFFV